MLARDPCKTSGLGIRRARVSGGRPANRYCPALVGPRPAAVTPRKYYEYVDESLSSAFRAERKLTDDRRSTQPPSSAEVLVRSRKRVADHGEVFTPAWLVENMLDLVKGETERIDSRFLEPGCGSGNFLVPVMRRKLAVVQARHGKSEFERRHFALFALMCIYGIELLPDNAAECRDKLLEVFMAFVGCDAGDEWRRAATVVLAANIVQGNALDMIAASGEHITMPEWAYLGRGKFQRRDFRYDALSQRSSIAGSLFEMLEEQEVFVPVAMYPPMAVWEIAS